MLAPHRKRAILGLSLALVIPFVVRLFTFDVWALRVTLATTTGLWLWGAFHLARGKGRHPALSLVALIPFGILVLLVIDDRHRSYPVRQPTGPEARECPECGFRFLASDYRSDAPEWLCSRCAAVLPRVSASTGTGA